MRRFILRSFRALSLSTQSATTLAYNTSLYLVCNESEALAQLVSAIVALLNEPSLKPEDETSFLLLVALGHFMCDSRSLTHTHNTHAHSHTVHAHKRQPTYSHLRTDARTVSYRHPQFTYIFWQVLQRHSR